MQQQRQYEGQVAALMQTGDYQLALEVLDRLLLTPSNSASLHWSRCQCLAKLKRPEEAREAVEKVLRLRSNFVPALMLRVKLARDYAEPFDIERLLRRVLLLEPQRARAQYWLADVLLAKGDAQTEQEALQLLDSCIEAAPTLLRARLRRADYYWVLYRQALKAMQIDGQAVQGFNDAHDALEKASVDYVHVAEHAHSDRAALRAAKALARLGRAAEAIPYLDTLMARVAHEDPSRPAISKLRERVMLTIATGDNPVGGETWPMPSTLLAAEVAEPQAAPSGSLEAVVSAIKRVIPAVVTAPRQHPTDDALALQLAKQLFSDAFEPSPDLLGVNVAEFPAYQTRYIEHRSKQLHALGFIGLGDVAPHAAGLGHGVRPLMRVFRHPTLGVVWVYAIQPQWAGGVASLIQAATGHWNIQRHVHALSMLSQEVFLSTQMGGDNAVDWSSKSFRFSAVGESSRLKVMLAQHETRLKRVWAQYAGAHLIVPHSLQEFQSQWRVAMAAKRSSQEEGAGGLTEDDLRRLLGKRYDRLHERVRVHFQSLLANRSTHFLPKKYVIQA
ncbi:tetratricopeptide repeat protein [Lampropedia puyangensis]|uniref:Tetratricopeptide repeat protein n=1 Tax=Lampropedia puyangensis TaxID=1330072 RepID=A0A4S8EV71_9BURK|nr:tetratricopeptide repeat protein [Lampropedia puyangensis]THT98769.1 tetratricopeptide repeat protein [Lampropedia puyangensis]